MTQEEIDGLAQYYADSICHTVKPSEDDRDFVKVRVQHAIEAALRRVEADQQATKVYRP